MNDICIVIGNGISLRDVPLEFLQKYPTFACNRIDKLTGFQPTYYSCLNWEILRSAFQLLSITPVVQNAERAFIHVMYTDYFPFQNIVAIAGRTPMDDSHHDFMHRPQVSYYKDRRHILVGVGYTQTYVNLQIAYWIGFRTALLVGIDHDYGSKDRHFYKDSEIEDYYPYETNPVKECIVAITVAGADRVYRLARESYEADGRHIINLTPNSKTDVFDFGDIEEWMR